MKKILFICSLLVIFSACNDKLNQPDLINNSFKPGMMVFTLGTNNTLADSLTYVTVKLSVDPTVYAKYKQVTFTISPVGKFSNDSSAITVPITVNDTAYARVFSSQWGRAYITAMVGNLTTIDSITFQPNNDSLKMTVTPPGTTADSLSYANVTLKVGASLYAKYKQAAFSISPVGRFNNDSTKIIVPIGTDSMAHLSVFSNISGTGIITATVGNLTCSDSVVFNVPSNALVLNGPPGLLPADNSTYATVNALISNLNLLQKMTTITFTTNKGTFANNLTTYTTNISSSSGGNPIAMVYLKDNKVESAVVTATIPVSGAIAYSSQTTVNFSTAYPTIISIIPTKDILNDTATSTAITAKLLRTPGYVTSGQVIYFSDTTLGISRGIFSNNPASVIDTGIALTTYTITDTSYHGNITITGKVYNTLTGGLVDTGMNIIHKQ